MADERTDRQRKADDALEDAISEVVAAYSEHDDGPLVMTSWITVVNHVGQDDVSGFWTTSILHPYRGGGTPWPQVFGLMHCAQLLLDRDYLTPHDD